MNKIRPTRSICRLSRIAENSSEHPSSNVVEKLGEAAKKRNLFIPTVAFIDVFTFNGVSMPAVDSGVRNYRRGIPGRNTLNNMYKNRSNLRGEIYEIKVRPNLPEERLLNNVEAPLYMIGKNKSKLRTRSLKEARRRFDVTTYILAPDYLLTHAKNVIRFESDSIRKMSKALDVKRCDPTYLRRSVLGLKPFDQIGGWFEYTNGFFFFTDWKMFTGTAHVFGLTRRELGPARRREPAAPVSFIHKPKPRGPKATP